jgi:hypothetical protein
MEMGVPFGIVSEGLNSQDYSRYSRLSSKGYPEKFAETGSCTFAQLAEQFSIIEEIAAKNLGDTENVLPVRHGKQDIILQMATELDYFF